MPTIWINVTTDDGELIERIAVTDGETARDLLHDINEAVERARRVVSARPGGTT